jgi:serine/threonine-protein kinase PknG
VTRQSARSCAISSARTAAARARNGTGPATPAGPATPDGPATPAGPATPDLDTAARLFQVVWTVDHSYVSAALGLARVRLAVGDRAGAVEVLAAVPETSSHYVTAQIAAVRARISGQDPARLAPADLQEAGRRLERLRLDTQRQQSLAIEILDVALAWVTSNSTGGSSAAGTNAAATSAPGGNAPSGSAPGGSAPGGSAPGGSAPGGSAPGGSAPGGERLLDCDLNERALRFGLEKSYRALARLMSRDDRRIELVDLANDVRPRTRF